MPIRIRRATRAESGELTRIAHAAKRFWRYPEQMMRLWGHDLTVTPDFLERHGVFCALRGSNVVGFYALSGTGESRELDHMWVDPAQIGSGVGRRLFTHLLSSLRCAGVIRLVIVSDPNAEGFYRRHGARRVGSVASTPAGRRLPLLVVRLRPVRSPVQTARKGSASSRLRRAALTTRKTPQRSPLKKEYPR